METIDKKSTRLVLKKTKVRKKARRTEKKEEESVKIKRIRQEI